MYLIIIFISLILNVRIPFVKDILTSLFNLQLSYTLDGLSVIARGAASLLANEKSEIKEKFIFENWKLELPEKSNFDENELKNQKEIFEKLAERNEEKQKIDESRNKLESFIINIKHDSEGKFKEKLPTEEIIPICNDIEDWLNDSDNYTLEEYDNKYKEITELLMNKYKPYYDEIEKIKIEKEKKLAEEVAKNKDVYIYI